MYRACPKSTERHHLTQRLSTKHIGSGSAGARDSGAIVDLRALVFLVFLMASLFVVELVALPNPYRTVLLSAKNRETFSLALRCDLWPQHSTGEKREDVVVG